MMNWYEKFKKKLFDKKTQISIHEIKNHSSRICIHKEIKEQSERKKIIGEERENDKIIKINLIKASKWKFDAKWQNIRRKTQNLTQNHARNDLIDSQIKVFIQRLWKWKFGIQEVIFFSFSRWNLDFKYSSEAEISLEHDYSKRFEDWDV